MGTVQPPVQRGRRHQRRPHAMLSQALLGMIQAAGAFQGQPPSANLPAPADLNFECKVIGPIQWQQPLAFIILS